MILDIAVTEKGSATPDILLGAGGARSNRDLDIAFSQSDLRGENILLGSLFHTNDTTDISLLQSPSGTATLESAAEKFNRLAKEWKEETGHFPKVYSRVTHATYRKIIKMEEIAIPFILKEFERGEYEHWLWALSLITGENPIPREATGNVKAMAQAWIQWGKKNNYLPN